MKIRDMHCDIDLLDNCPECNEKSLNGIATEFYCDSGGINYIKFVCSKCGYIFDLYEPEEECDDSTITDDDKNKFMKLIQNV